MIHHNQVSSPAARTEEDSPACTALSGSAFERAEAIAERCGGGRERHGTWTVRCPAHPDSSPSLVISPVGDKVLLNCFGGCHTEAVLAAVGLGFRDVFADNLPFSPCRKRPAHLGPRIPQPPGGPTK